MISKGRHRYESKFLRKNKTSFLAEISASWFEIGGEVRIRGIVRDITDKRRLQKEREQAVVELEQAMEEAERANKAKSFFLANLSHEIRTPLNGILGFAEVLSKTEMSERQSGFLKTICASGEVLLNIINDTLDLSRIEQGHIVLTVEDFSPADCVEGVVDILMAKASEQELELNIELEDALPATISGDLNRLRQVLLNLINNALKFTSEGTVTARLYRDPQQSNSRLIFEVEDTGKGISPRDLKILFQPFTQFGDGADSREGAALGLAICRSLVEAMGGDQRRKRAESWQRVQVFSAHQAGG